MGFGEKILIEISRISAKIYVVV